MIRFAFLILLFLKESIFTCTPFHITKSITTPHDYAEDFGIEIVWKTEKNCSQYLFLQENGMLVQKEEALHNFAYNNHFYRIGISPRKYHISPKIEIFIGNEIDNCKIVLQVPTKESFTNLFFVSILDHLAYQTILRKSQEPNAFNLIFNLGPRANFTILDIYCTNINNDERFFTFPDIRSYELINLPRVEIGILDTSKNENLDIQIQLYKLYLQNRRKNFLIFVGKDGLEGPRINGNLSQQFLMDILMREFLSSNRVNIYYSGSSNINYRSTYFDNFTMYINTGFYNLFHKSDFGLTNGISLYKGTNRSIGQIVLLKNGRLFYSLKEVINLTILDSFEWNDPDENSVPYMDKHDILLFVVFIITLFSLIYCIFSCYIQIKRRRIFSMELQPSVVNNTDNMENNSEI